MGDPYGAWPLRNLVEQALGVNLTNRDRFILATRLGWGGQRVLTQDEIAIALTKKGDGVSQPQVSIDERNLKSRLRRVIEKRRKYEHAEDVHREALAAIYRATMLQAEELGVSQKELQTLAFPPVEVVDAQAS
ncbi:MAG TPA: hypothetical protein VJA46_14280 [Acidimicrobiia bacterium]|nr:hypothetical protein [Acidimicrobiia bacterium]